MSCLPRLWSHGLQSILGPFQLHPLLYCGSTGEGSPWSAIVQGGCDKEKYSAQFLPRVEAYGSVCSQHYAAAVLAHQDGEWRKSQLPCTKVSQADSKCVCVCVWGGGGSKTLCGHNLMSVGPISVV